MMKNTNTKPILRFPKFKEEWKEYRLSDFLTRYSETNKDEEFSLDEILSLSSHYGIVSRKELLEETYSNVNHLSYKKTRLNDLVYGKSISASYPYGLFKVNDFKDGLLSTLYYTFKVKDYVFPKFIDCYFSHLNRANNFLKKLVLVGDRYITADANYLLSGKIYLPTQKEEQKKITDFLIQIDNRIAQLTEKKAHLELYKKGITQKIFSQKLRFKDENGMDFPEWEPIKLKEILKERKLRNTKKQIGEVFSVAKERGVINQIEHLGRSYASDDISNYKVVCPNDVVYTKSPTAGFPFGIIKQNKLDRTGVVSVLYAVFKPKNIELGLLLDFYFSSWVNTYNYLVPLVHKGAKNTMNIGNEEFLNGTKVYFPTHKEEQEKIASFLNEISQQISLVNEQLEETRTFKKGLLQKMFC